MTLLISHDHHLITKGMGGLFSERSDLSGVHRILDAACGPGGWALEVAFTYPEIEVVGFDISRAMIDYARSSYREQASLKAGASPVYCRC
jgi:ubiquinone/menaquinone biosynthesis C-methylase UbiE